MRRIASNSFIRIIFLLALCTLGISSNLSAQTWSSVDGGGVTGINSATATTSEVPYVSDFYGELYAIWTETMSGTPQVHIKKYNGSTWSPVGNTAGQSQLNTSTALATEPKIVTYNGALYAGWQENESGISNIHIKKYNGSSWTFTQNYYVGDGRVNINRGTTANAQKVDLTVFNNELYAVWIEANGGGGSSNQVRVAKFDGNFWSCIDGNGNYGINYNTALNAFYPSFGVYNGKLYVAWSENNASSVPQLRVRRYDGSSTWTFIDGNGATGLNYEAAKSINGTPVLASYNGKLFAFWSENNKIRLKQYDETNGWASGADGGTNGWNYNAADEAYNPFCFVYNNLIYVSWEQNPAPRKIHVVTFNGTTKTFIDDNANVGINFNTAMAAHYPKMTEYNGNLYAVWNEDNAEADNAQQIRAKKYTLPAVTTSVAVPANATYTTSTSLDFTVNFNKIVNVAGDTPYIPITLNTGGTVNATYISGSGTAALTFRYTVAAGNADPDGISVGSSIVLPGGCTLRDASSGDAFLTLNSVGSTTGVMVDGIAPVVSSINRQTPATSPTNATSLIYRVIFSESVNNVDISDFTLTKTATATGTIASVTSSSGTTIDVTVNAVSGYGTLRLDLNSSGTGITDASGNPINGGYTGGQTYTNTNMATLTTQAVSGIGSTTATGNGNITNLGYPNPTAYGICYGTTANPDITGNKVDKGAASVTGAFTAQLIGLTPGTTYHARAFATNTAGPSYGDDVTFTTTSAMTEPGNALNFDGTDDYVNLGDKIEGLATLTFETWVYYASGGSSDYDEIFSKENVNSLNIWRSGGDKVWFHLGTGTTWFDGGRIVSNSSIPKDRWTHIAVTWDQATTTVKIYINGVLDITALHTHSGGSVMGSNSALRGIGRYPVVPGHPFKGKLDELRAWNVVRSQAEIQSDMVTAISSSAGLLCSFNFNEGTAGGNNTAGTTILTDLTSNGNNGTLTNFARTGTTSNWVESYAMVVPIATAATSVSASGFTVNWTAPTTGTVNNYLLDVATDAAFTSLVSGYNPKTIAAPSTSSSVTGLSSHTQYYYRLRADKTSITGQGAYSNAISTTTLFPASSTFNTTGNWSTAGNWSNGLPGSATEATISANCTVDGNFATENLIISANGALTIATGNTLTVNGDLDLESDDQGTASLINNGTLTASGPITAQRYMTGNKWHIISPTAAGGTVAAFLTANSNIPTSGTNRGMMDYFTDENRWNSYYPNTGATGTMDAGKGYSARITADGVVTFSGTLTSGTTTVTLTKVGADNGWNCIGNPYPSAINMNAAAGTNNFLKTNAIDASNLDASYACIYVWDQDVAAYKILGNSSYDGRDLGQNVFSPGQGFFVKAKTTGTDITFTAAMQTHQATTALKSAKVSWPGFELTATTAQAKASTIVAFNSKMTNGLDVTYDAGLLRGSSGLELYSRLVTDNGVDFAIQCLPENYPSLVIPLGLDCKTGGEVTFSAETVELPAACSVILEDKMAKTFTSLAGGATYKATVPAGATGTGRFYIHTNDVISGVSDLPSAATFSLKVYPANGEIIIEGEVSNQAKAALFDLNGKKLGAYALQGQNRNTISVAGVVPGVYLLNVTDSGKRFTTKIVID